MPGALVVLCCSAVLAEVFGCSRAASTGHRARNARCACFSAGSSLQLTCAKVQRGQGTTCTDRVFPGPGRAWRDVNPACMCVLHAPRPACMRSASRPGPIWALYERQPGPSRVAWAGMPRCLQAPPPAPVGAPNERKQLSLPAQQRSLRVHYSGLQIVVYKNNPNHCAQLPAPPLPFGANCLCSS